MLRDSAEDRNGLETGEVGKRTEVNYETLFMNIKIGC